MEKASIVLNKVLSLISNKDHWTEKVFAKNKFNHPCSWLHPDACKFCAGGAIRRALDLPASMTPQQVRPDIIKLINTILNTTWDTSLSNLCRVNDGVDGHPNVIIVLNKCIELAITEGN